MKGKAVFWITIGTIIGSSAGSIIFDTSSDRAIDPKKKANYKMASAISGLISSLSIGFLFGLLVGESVED